jgi:hypothetical protein
MGNQQERSLAWLAGILDGEGTISVQVYTYPDGRIRLTPYVTIINTDRALLAEARRICAEVVGERGITYLTNHCATSSKKACFAVRINGGPGVKALLEVVISYLQSAKCNNAQVVLDFIESRDRRLLRRDKLGRIERTGYSAREIDLICSIRTSPLAKSSEAIRQAPNYEG